MPLEGMAPGPPHDRHRLAHRFVVTCVTNQDLRPHLAPLSLPRLLRAPRFLSTLSSNCLRLVPRRPFSRVVTICHAADISRRDGKPENFVVADGWIRRLQAMVQGRRQPYRLCLTSHAESADMDRGSALDYSCYGRCSRTPPQCRSLNTVAPRFFYTECRNYVAPTLSWFCRCMVTQTRAYRYVCLTPFISHEPTLNRLRFGLHHYNPLSDTAEGACLPFKFYNLHLISFFM